MMTTKVTKKGLICMQQLDETDDYMQVESKDKRFWPVKQSRVCCVICSVSNESQSMQQQFKPLFDILFKKERSFIQCLKNVHLQ